MKKTAVLILFCFFINPLLKAQINEIKACDNDTVYLLLNSYHGQVQWQSSTDTIVWQDIMTIGDTLVITLSPDMLYRAVVKDGTCDSVLSDTTSIRFFPVPTTAYAGTDQLNLNNVNTILDATPALIGTGTWSIFNGTGGIIADTSNPGSAFTGVGASTYNLVWTVKNECRTTKDTVQLSFAMPQVNCNGTMYVHPVDNHGGSIWGCPGTTTNATSLTNGAQNTNLIVAACTDQTIAARRCSDLVAYGYSDWYLPSADELNCLYVNRASLGGFYTFSGIVYWSSTETNANWANAQNFNTGLQTTINQKGGACRVRCVRRD